MKIVQGFSVFVTIDGLIDNVKTVENGFTPDLQEISLFIEFLYGVDENIFWRYDTNFGAESNNMSDLLYVERQSFW